MLKRLKKKGSCKREFIEQKIFLFCSKKKVFLFYIYNFYFKNLIYKWINQFENQQENDSIFQAMFQQKLELYFYQIVL